VSSRPSLSELREVTQPASTMSRRNAEHWLARIVLRKVSLRVTSLLIRTPVTANQLTGLMIVVGLIAAVPAGLAGFGTAVIAWLLVLGYFLLDLCDGEVARWHKQTSVTGVYLDRVGHYIVEAALLTAYGVRAGGQQWGMWSTLGAITALLAILVKAETDLVDVARARKGLPVVQDGAAADTGVDAATPRNSAMAGIRRVVSKLHLHQITGALESSALLVVAAGYDVIRGGDQGVKVFAGLMFVVAATMAVLHLVSILASRRLQ